MRPQNLAPKIAPVCPLLEEHCSSDAHPPRLVSMQSNLFLGEQDPAGMAPCLLANSHVSLWSGLIPP